jgi:hypothetical protein
MAAGDMDSFAKVCAESFEVSMAIFVVEYGYHEGTSGALMRRR